MIKNKKLILLFPLLSLGVLYLVIDSNAIGSPLQSAFTYGNQIKAFLMGYPILVLGSYSSFIPNSKYKYISFMAIGFLFGTFLYSSSVPSLLFYTIYLVLSTALVCNLKYKLFYTRIFYLITYMLLLFSGWYACLQSHSFVQMYLIAFLTYDATLAWTWLCYTSLNKSREKIDSSQLFLYFIFPGFFLRRIAISFEEFSLGLSKPIQSDTFLKGWSLLFKSLFLFIAFLATASFFSDLLGLIYFELYMAFFLAYAYLNLSTSIFLIYGIDVRYPCDNFLMTSHPVDFWRRWNVYMRDWLKTFYFFPAIKLFKRVEIAFLVVFFFSGIFHMLPYVVLSQIGSYKQLFKFWIPGIYIAGFSYFYIRYRYIYFKLNRNVQRSILIFGALTFWILYFMSRDVVFYLSQWLFWKSI